MIANSDGDFADAGDTAQTVKVTAIGRNGFVLNQGTGGGNIAVITAMDVTAYPMRTAKKRQLRIAITQEADVAPNADKGLIAKVVIEIPVRPRDD